MHRAGLVRLVRMGLVYLLVAAAAALGWLWRALPEQVYLEPGTAAAMLPRFGWVEPLARAGKPQRGQHPGGGQLSGHTGAGRLAAGAAPSVRWSRERPTVTVCGTPFGVKMFSEGALVVGFSDVHTAAGHGEPGQGCRGCVWGTGSSASAARPPRTTTP